METKICNRCKEELPLSEIYYRKKKMRGKYVDYSICKQCEIEERFLVKCHIKENQIGDKVCKQCERELPRDNNHFQKNSQHKDGLSTNCRECCGGTFKRDGYITCSECKIDFPSTEEYFYHKEGGRFNLSTICKKCSSILAKPKNLKRYKLHKTEIIEYKKVYTKSHLAEKSQHDKNYRNTSNGKIIRHKSEMKRRALIQSLPYEFNDSDWIVCLNYFTESDGVLHCAYCGEVLDKPTHEHVIPVSKDGGVTKDNIIVCCASCNSSKGNNNFEDWYKTQECYSLDRQIKILNYIQQYKQ